MWAYFKVCKNVPRSGKDEKSLTLFEFFGKKISSNTDTKIGPWFRFLILKPSFGHTLVCRHESLENLLANQFYHNLFACMYIGILFSMFQQICLKDPIFFNCPLYRRCIVCHFPSIFILRSFLER